MQLLHPWVQLPQQSGVTHPSYEGIGVCQRWEAHCVHLMDCGQRTESAAHDRGEGAPAGGFLGHLETRDGSGPEGCPRNVRS